VALAVVLFAVVFTLRLLLGDISDGYNMLYTLPIALLATAFGRRAGLLAALVAVALIVVWVVADDVPMTATRWVTRFVPLLLLGLLVGDASDRLRKAEQERLQLAGAARLHREAIEINDSLVQGMAAAKWSIESGRNEVGLATLDQTISMGHALVSGLIRDAGLGPNGERGVGPDGQHQPAASANGGSPPGRTARS
jgi:hypothetical protein